MFALKIYLIPNDVDNKMMGHMILELGYVHLGALAKMSTSYECSQNVEQHHWSKSSISVEDLIFLWLQKAYKVFFLITLCSFSPLLFNLIESDCKKKYMFTRSLWAYTLFFSRKINQLYCWILVIHGVLICIKYILNQYHRINVWDLLM